MSVYTTEIHGDRITVLRHEGPMGVPVSSWLLTKKDALAMVAMLKAAVKKLPKSSPQRVNHE